MDAIHAKSLPPCPSLEQYKKQAKDLLRTRRAADPSASWSLSAAQLEIAREHGFASWPKFSKHLRELEHGRAGHFEAAVDAIVSGDRATLDSLLDADPGLVHERSARVHEATLLHYIAANGVENYRQKTPGNAVDIADALLRRGAEVNATANMYGHAATTMGLLVSSIHPANAGLQAALVDKLVDYGAAVDSQGDESPPLIAALAFTCPDAVDALVRRGARVDTIPLAAGIGRADLLRTFVDDPSSLHPGATIAGTRALAIPNDSFGWALVFAAAYGHTGVVDFLVRRGVDLGARGMVGFTALHWAAIRGHADVVDLLLEHQAPLEDTQNNHHSTALGCAVWAATDAETLRDNARRQVCEAIVERLLAAGANADAIMFPTGNTVVDELLRPHRSQAGQQPTS